MTGHDKFIKLDQIKLHKVLETYENIDHIELNCITTLLSTFTIRNPTVTIEGNQPLFRRNPTRTQYSTLFDDQKNYLIEAQLKVALEKETNDSSFNCNDSESDVSIDISSDDDDDENDEVIDSKLITLKVPIRKTPTPNSQPLLPPSPTDFRCNECPDWFNEFAVSFGILNDEDSLQGHKKCWHRDKYHYDDCKKCFFRAENLPLMKKYHDYDKMWCKEAEENGTYRQLQYVSQVCSGPNSTYI